MRPAHREMVVRLRAAEFVDAFRQVLGRLQRLQAVEVAHLVEAAVDRALGRGAVVADDVIDQRVVGDAQLLDRLVQAAHVVIGELEEARIDLHLPAQHRLERLRHVVPARHVRRPRGELGICRDHAQRFLAGEGLLAQRIPAGVELALVLVGPFPGHMVRGMGRAGGEVAEERLVRRKGLLLLDPADGLVRHVLHQVVALLGRLRRRDRGGTLDQRGIPLVRLAADEAVEVLEAATTRRPLVEGADRARLPHRHLVAFAELRGVVAIELERLGQRRDGIGQHRGVARLAGGDLGDAGHAGVMVIAAGQQGLARRRADGRGMEAVVLETARGQLVGRRRGAGAAEGAGRAEAAVVDEHDEHVRRAFGRTQLLDRGGDRIRVLGIVIDEARRRGVAHRQVGTGFVVWFPHCLTPCLNVKLRYFVARR